MPVQVSYPGVYIEEIPSGVRTIAGVATSITAFVGRARRGPANQPVVLNSYADFERRFGGLWNESTLSFAVRDYFLNGGSQAIIVRLFNPTFADEASRLAALAAAQAQAQTAANAVVTAAQDVVTAASTAALAAAQAVADAATAAVAGGAATPQDVANAAQAAVAAAGAAGAVALAAATGVADAANAAVAGGAAAPQDVANAAVAAVAGAAAAAAAAVTPQNVADAAQAAVAAAGAAGAAALAAAREVAGAAQAAVAGAAASQAVATAAQAAAAGAVNAAAIAQAPVTRAQVSAGTLGLEAAYEGSWGNQLRVRVDHNVAGPDAATLFNLTVLDGSTGEIEVLRNLSVAAAHARRADNVLRKESRLVRVLNGLPPARPAASPVPAAGANPFGAASSSGVSQPASDGNVLASNDYLGNQAAKTGIYALEEADIFNLLCLPPYTSGTDVSANVWSAAAAYCERRRAVLLVDAPSGWTTKDAAVAGMGAGVGTVSRNAALYFPRMLQANPMRDNQIESFAPCGAVAGIIARTDGQRGIWKAPAGMEATLAGASGLSLGLTDAENGELNPLGVNCLRSMPPAGRVIWGARTLQGDDRFASEWKYLPVRRLALYIEESLYRGTQWAVFEPNDEPLWAQIRLNLGAFMHGLFRQGAFQGSKPADAYLVKCDKETTTQDDINRGIVNILVGFAPLKPAEFVIIKLQQLAGQTQA